MNNLKTFFRCIMKSCFFLRKYLLKKCIHFSCSIADKCFWSVSFLMAVDDSAMMIVNEVAISFYALSFYLWMEWEGKWFHVIFTIIKHRSVRIWLNKTTSRWLYTTRCTFSWILKKFRPHKTTPLCRVGMYAF